MAEEERSETQECGREFERRMLVRYAVLTLALFVPLLWAFVAVRNLYPVSASTMMMVGGSERRRGGAYYILRGETVSGETIDIPAIKLSDALSGRIWGMVSATVENKSFEILSPHPSNAALIAVSGGSEQVPRGARVPDLLRSWGMIYNSRHLRSSAGRLKAVRLDAYVWEGKSYDDYGRYVETWRAEL